MSPELRKNAELIRSKGMAEALCFFNCAQTVAVTGEGVDALNQEYCRQGEDFALWKKYFDGFHSEFFDFREYCERAQRMVGELFAQKEQSGIYIAVSLKFYERTKKQPFDTHGASFRVHDARHADIVVW